MYRDNDSDDDNEDGHGGNGDNEDDDIVILRIVMIIQKSDYVFNPRCRTIGENRMNG